MFKDENADKMRAIAKTIKPTEVFANSGGHGLEKAGPISSQFFPQKEMNIAPLNFDDLVAGLAGADDAARARFRVRMQALYPTEPKMWSIEPPSLPSRESNYAGGMAWPKAQGTKASSGGLHKSVATDAESAKRLADLGTALARLRAVRAVKEAVDAGQLSGKAVAAALAAA